MEKLTKEEICYIAGIVDGEGCVRIGQSNKRRGFNLSLVITNTCEELINWLAEKLEGAHIYTQKPVKSHHKTHYEVKWFGEVAKRILEMLSPYLIIKREITIVALTFPVGVKGCVSGVAKKEGNMFKKDKIQQSACYIQAKRLNKKGNGKMNEVSCENTDCRMLKTGNVIIPQGRE